MHSMIEHLGQYWRNVCLKAPLGPLAQEDQRNHILGSEQNKKKFLH